MSRSAGRDCCSPTKRAVCGRSIEAPLAAALDEYEQRPVHHRGEMPAAPLISVRLHRPGAHVRLGDRQASTLTLSTGPLRSCERLDDATGSPIGVATISYATSATPSPGAVCLRDGR